MNLVDQGRGHGVVITTGAIRASRSFGLKLSSSRHLKTEMPRISFDGEIRVAVTTRAAGRVDANERGKPIPGGGTQR
jgi:hypothetical protein